MGALFSNLARLRSDQSVRNTITHQTIPAVAGFFAAGYAAYGLGVVLFMAPETAWIMGPVSAILAVVGLAVFIQARQHKLATSWANHIMSALSVLMFAHAGTLFWVSGAPHHSANLGLAVMCLGLLHLSPVFFAASYLAGIVASLWLASLLLAPEEIAEYSFFFFSCTVVAVVAFIVRWRAYGRLIAARRKAESREASVQKAYARARLAEESARDSRAKSEFLANMSHELRTPLNAIIGFSEVIKNELMGPIGNEVYVDYAKDVHESGNNLLRMLNDILEIARVDMSTAAYEEVVCDVEELFDRVLALVRGRGNGPLLSIESHVDAQVRHIQCDELRLKRALLHIASNAVKYTPPGGSVRLEAGLAEAGDGTLQVEFTVSDTGRGMSADEIDRAFHVFWQSKEAYIAEHGGVGLGLPLAREFARQQGGDLQLESAPGEGLVARLTLPGSAVRSEAASEEVTAPVHAGAAQTQDLRSA